MAALETTPRGLSSAAVEERRRRFGPNALPEPAVRLPLAMLLSQFQSVPVALLAASAFVSLCTGGLADAAAMAAVALINAAIGFTSESLAERTIASLTSAVKRRAVVIRDGVHQGSDARNVVRGDSVVLTPGAYVPADLRLLRVRDLAVDESTLTGESEPVLTAGKAARVDLGRHLRAGVFGLGSPDSQIRFAMASSRSSSSSTEPVSDQS